MEEEHEMHIIKLKTNKSYTLDSYFTREARIYELKIGESEAGKWRYSYYRLKSDGKKRMDMKPIFLAWRDMEPDSSIIFPASIVRGPDRDEYCAASVWALVCHIEKNGYKADKVRPGEYTPGWFEGILYAAMDILFWRRALAC